MGVHQPHVTSKFNHTRLVVNEPSVFSVYIYQEQLTDPETDRERERVRDVTQPSIKGGRQMEKC